MLAGLKSASAILAAVILFTSHAHAFVRTSESEAVLLDRALQAAGRYAVSERFYVYRPAHSPKERAASTVAVSAHLFIEMWLMDRQDRWLVLARRAGDSLLANMDMNRDGAVGWGRFWHMPKPRESIPNDGSNTSFAIGCQLERNRPYDDEMYDNARIGHFLLDLAAATGDARYADAARRMIDDTWNVGATTSEGAFYYFKTIGPCDRGWHVKNVNMLMAVPVAILARMTGERKYRERAEAMMRAQLHEVRRKVAGRPAPNLGYYAVHTMIERPRQGTYVIRAQTTDLDQPIACNPRTGAGESCTAHLGLEARSMHVVARTLRRPELVREADVKLVMSGKEARDAEMCLNEKTALGRPRRPTMCAAYYCALRGLEPRYGDLCLARTANSARMTPDITLGLFWGREGRFPLAR